MKNMFSLDRNEKFLTWNEPVNLELSTIYCFDYLNRNIRENLEEYMVAFNIDPSFKNTVARKIIFDKLFPLLKQLFVVLQTVSWEWIITGTYSELKNNPIFVLNLAEIANNEQLDCILARTIVKNNRNFVERILDKLPIFMNNSQLIWDLNIDKTTCDTELNINYKVSWKWEDILRNLITYSKWDFKIFWRRIMQDYSNMIASCL